jgi:hypothetical protein
MAPHDDLRVCRHCGHIGPAKTSTRGSTGVELVLWLLLLVPGLIYSVWRLSTKHPACTACGSDQLLPLGSPMAAKLMADCGTAPPSAHNATAPIRPPRAGAVQLGRTLGRWATWWRRRP